MSNTHPWTTYYPPQALELDLNSLQYSHLADPVRSAAMNFGDRLAATTILPNGASASVTYNELDRLSDNFAIYLREHLKLGKGDVIAIMSANCINFTVACFGIVKAGCTVTNINPMYTADEMKHQLCDSGAKALVVLDLFGDKVDAVVPYTNVQQVITVSVLDPMPALKPGRKAASEMHHPHITLLEATTMGAGLQAHNGADVLSYIDGVSADDTVLFQYTGGTTGRSKGAELTHHNILANACQGLALVDEIGEEQETLLVILPLYHITAFTLILFAGVMKGAHLIMVPSPRPISNLQKAFELFPPHRFSGINTLYAALLQEPWFHADLCRTLRFCSSGGAAQHVAVAEEWEKLTGVPIVQGYGLTECAGVLTLNPPNHNRLGYVGIPAPGMEVMIIGKDGKGLPHGEAGELIAKGPTIMKGYHGHAAESATAITDGWLHTGDIAVMEDDGFIKIVDRLKDMILVSGFNVYPNEIEDVLAKLDGVAEVGVIGVPDPKSDEVPKAFIVKSNPNLSKEAVITHCREHLTGYKVPKHVIFVDDIPKSLAGKVLRKYLRDM